MRVPALQVLLSPFLQGRPLAKRGRRVAVSAETVFDLQEVSSQPPEPSVVSDPGQPPVQVCFPNSYFCVTALS